MKLLKQGPGAKLCMLYSFAMLMDMDPDDLADDLGWCGDEPFFGPDPRGHHPQEFIDYALNHQMALVEIMMTPIAECNNQVHPIWGKVTCNSRMASYLGKYSGLLLGVKDGVYHMAAWDGNSYTIHDPNGKYFSVNMYASSRSTDWPYEIVSFFALLMI
jgi:hypothetical protein